MRIDSVLRNHVCGSHTAEWSRHTARRKARHTKNKTSQGVEKASPAQWPRVETHQELTMLNCTNNVGLTSCFAHIIRAPSSHNVVVSSKWFSGQGLSINTTKQTVLSKDESPQLEKKKGGGTQKRKVLAPTASVSVCGEAGWNHMDRRTQIPNKGSRCRFLNSPGIACATGGGRQGQ